MKKETFEQAKDIESKIKKINHIVTGLNAQSFFRVILINCGDDKTKLLNEFISSDYSDNLNKAVIDSLTLQRLKLQEQFAKIIDI